LDLFVAITKGVGMVLKNDAFAQVERTASLFYPLKAEMTFVVGSSQRLCVPHSFFSNNPMNGLENYRFLAM
jgi:hypothetical protein